METRTTPLFSPDGTRIAFSTASSNVVPADTNLKSDVFVRTIVGRNVVRVSVVSPTLEGNGASTEPSLSDNASRVAFTSAATNFSFADTNSALDVFAADLCLASMVTYCTAGTTVHGCVPSITG
ncbi:MAG: PD40 domain-containing protein [Sandaracinaceae bacterium]|nr:PD40 domain-containing protein [Sandaracinaceae bacterium]